MAQRIETCLIYADRYCHLTYVVIVAIICDSYDNYVCQMAISIGIRRHDLSAQVDVAIWHSYHVWLNALRNVMCMPTDIAHIAITCDSAPWGMTWVLRQILLFDIAIMCDGKPRDVSCVRRQILPSDKGIFKNSVSYFSINIIFTVLQTAGKIKGSKMLFSFIFNATSSAAALLALRALWQVVVILLHCSSLAYLISHVFLI
jgi:hypothetical protein